MRILRAFILSILLVINIQCDTLRQLIVVSRHGIRSPAQLLPGRTCKFQQLNARVTEVGHMQNYALGAYLKTKYSTLLSQYDRKHHIFYATDADKNVMSGNTVAQGVYPEYFTTIPMPEKYDSERSLSITPSIPVRFAPAHVLDAESSAQSCQTLINSMVVNEITSSDETKKMVKKWGPAFKKIQEQSGVTDRELKFPTSPRFAEQNILTKGHLDIMRENSIVSFKGADGSAIDETELNKCLYDGEYEDSENKTSYTDIVILLATKRQQIASNKDLKELAKLRTTPFILFLKQKIQQYVENHKDGAKEFYSFIFFLGENGNVQNLMQLFGRNTPGRVPFGSAIAFELYQKDSGSDSEESSYGLRIKYHRMSNATLQVEEEVEWTRDICGSEYCTVKQLTDLVFTNEEWRSKCLTSDNGDAQYYEEELRKSEAAVSDAEDDKKFYQNMFIIFLVVLLVLLVACIIIIVLQCCGCIGGSSSNQKKDETVAEEPTEEPTDSA